MNKALVEAVRANVLFRNPVTAVKPPRAQIKSMETWDVETFNTFAETAKDNPLLPVYRIAVLTGMRRSELCGLKWDVVDLDAGHLRVIRTLQPVLGKGLVEGQPKTGRSHDAPYLLV